MSKVFFEFEFSDRFLAKKLSLKWDNKNKKWYCSDDSGFGMYQNMIFQIYMLLPIRLRLINYDLSCYKENIISKIQNLTSQELKDLEDLYKNNIVVKSNFIDKEKNYGKNFRKYDYFEKIINDLKFKKT